MWNEIRLIDIVTFVYYTPLAQAQIKSLLVYQGKTKAGGVLKKQMGFFGFFFLKLFFKKLGIWI